MRIRWAAPWCVVGCLIIVGCGDERFAEVKGTVKVDGIPVESGSINFFPADGKTGTGGGPIKKGEYSAKAAVGLMKVTISAPKPTGETRKAYDTPNAKVVAIMKESLPDTVANRESTELQYDVKPGLNVRDWDLKSK